MDALTVGVVSEFSDALNQILKDRGLPATELAKMVGVSQSAVSKWTRGGSIEPTNVFAVERALNLKPGALSRLLGYLPVEAKPVKTPEEAVEADASLGDLNRRLVLAALRFARESQ